MRNFVLSVKAKSDLVAIARHTEQQWGRAQRNAYLAKQDPYLLKMANMLVRTNESI